MFQLAEHIARDTMERLSRVTGVALPKGRKGEMYLPPQAEFVLSNTWSEVLSPEQMKELDKIREERRGRARERMRR